MAKSKEHNIDLTKFFDLDVPMDEIPVGPVKCHFLDSGSFTLWTKSAEYAAANKCGRYDFYETPEFWQYIDAYSEFVKKYTVAIDLYANVDVIPNPELTLRNQEYLEGKGLKPVPVVHYTTDLKWLKFYIERGHDLVALGGLVGSTAQDECRSWIDRAFDIVCDTPDRMPKVKIHGFGVTSYALLLRYPWFCVDSTAWTKIGAFGGVLVPHKRGGKFVFTEQPYMIPISMDSPSTKLKGRHFSTLNAAEKNIIQEWLDLIGVKLGKFKIDSEDKIEITEFGVMTRHTERRVANLLFFEKMRKAIPQFPFSFQSTRRKGFGLI